MARGQEVGACKCCQVYFLLDSAEDEREILQYKHGHEETLCYPVEHRHQGSFGTVVAEKPGDVRRAGAYDGTIPRYQTSSFQKEEKEEKKSNEEPNSEEQERSIFGRSKQLTASPFSTLLLRIPLIPMFD
uniref:Uncharacterized protein n=1 Tax=Trichuris muris TaxID=70415 RepID=A0A5S6QV19_TRIMR